MLSWRNIVRLVLMAFHFLFTIIPLGLCYAQTADLALVAVHAQAFIACLVYIPAAFVLAIIDSPSRFTQAGGEVGYLVVQQCLWLRTSLLSSPAMLLRGHTVQAGTRYPRG